MKPTNAKEMVKNRTQQKCFQRCAAALLFNSVKHLYSVCHFDPYSSFSHLPTFPSLIIFSCTTKGGRLFTGVKAVYQVYTTEKK